MNLRQIFLIVSFTFFLVSCASFSNIEPEVHFRKGLIDLLVEKDRQSQKVLKTKNIFDPKKRDYMVRRIKNWNWPLDSLVVTSGFGKRGKKNHEGIDFRANVGTTVYAVAQGKVVYSSQRISGYGKMVVLRHQDGLVSVYAHLSKRLVKKGDRVRKGQKLALSGNTGSSSGPHLHFELRDGSQPFDPMGLLFQSKDIKMADSGLPRTETVY